MKREDVKNKIPGITEEQLNWLMQENGSDITREKFLSTLSLRRATFLFADHIELRAISIHALLAESDQPATKQAQNLLNFYPRSPCGERHHYGWSWYDDFTISIHALLAESDF